MAYKPLVQAWRSSFRERTPMRYDGEWSARMERDLGAPMRSPSRTRTTARRERRTERRSYRVERRARTR